MARQKRPKRVRPRRTRQGAVGRWVRQHPIAVWYVSASAVAAVLYAVAAPLEAVQYGAPVLVALLITAARFGAIVLAVRFPLSAAMLFAAASVVVRWSPAPNGLPWPWTVTTMVGFVALVLIVWARHGWLRGLIVYAVPAVSVSALAAIEFDARSLSGFIVAVSVGAVAAGAAALLRERARLGRALTKEREVSEAEQERRLVSEERQRIARELHDVVAHGLSLIQVQATSARYRLQDVPDDAAAEFDDIAASARTSLAEMRHLLGALRGDEQPAQHAPQPTIEDVGDLVADARRAGADASLTAVNLDSVPTAVSLTSYRIVQEALSNAIRHAPGTRVDIALHHDDGRLLIEVRNSAPAQPAPRASGSGHGLIGMRERAGLLGGTLTAGATDVGGYLIRAELPVESDGTGQSMTEDR
ncbi:sensor histidine kinase [Microbacterium sp. JB110]|uniref:sensor histidine kinase n=1 Tax=Microbacterium sp. JB110 TaxID=2024477 RepID=UPI0011219DC6|nr:sensor histidine kinase [Microbacterium sp. JB110]